MSKIHPQSEMLRALREERVHFNTPENPAYKDFPYVMFTSKVDGMFFVDAWHVNAQGQSHPDEAVPVPVAVSGTSSLDFAPPEIRRPFISFAMTAPAPPSHEGFTNFETSALAEALSSDGKVWDLLLAANAVPGRGAPDGEAFKNAVLSYVRTNRAKLIGRDSDLANVRWEEVAACFEAESCPRTIPVDPAPGQVTPEAPLPDELEGSPELATRPVPEDVLAVLRRCTVEGRVIKLPPERMDPKAYKRVNEVLVTLGGKWVGRSTQGHVFEDDPAQMLQAVSTSGLYLNPKDYGFFPTQKPEADKVVLLADLRPGMKTLEPSAGAGGLAIPAAMIVGIGNVTVCEILNGNVAKLREAGFANVIHGDFLSVKPEPVYERVVMNPPFGRLQDIDHFLHAAKFLDPEQGRLVAIMSPSWEFHTSRKAQDFRELIEECQGTVHQVDAGAFKSAGTNVRTTIVCVDAENLPWNRRERPREQMRA